MKNTKENSQKQLTRMDYESTFSIFISNTFTSAKITTTRNAT